MKVKGLSEEEVESEEEDEVKATAEDLRAKEEAENEYEVEEIVDKQVLRTSSRLGPKVRVRYLVKWKNWGDDHNSWESLENLAGAMETVEEFEERLAARGDRHVGKAHVAD